MNFLQKSSLYKQRNSQNEKDLLNQLINNQKSGCKEVRFKLLKLSLSELNLITNVVFLLICGHIISMKKNKKIEEVIRVDHAGERGASTSMMVNCLHYSY